MPKHLTYSQRRAIIVLYQAGSTVMSLSEQFDKDRTTIDRLLRTHAIRRGHVHRPRGKRQFAYYRHDEDKALRLDRLHCEAPPPCKTGRPRQTHCKRGHPFTFENTRQRKRGKECRICTNANFKIRYNADPELRARMQANNARRKAEIKLNKSLQPHD